MGFQFLPQLIYMLCCSLFQKSFMSSTQYSALLHLPTSLSSSWHIPLWSLEATLH